MSELMSRWRNHCSDPVTSEGCEGDAGPADAGTEEQTKAKAKAGAEMEAVSRSHGYSCATFSCPVLPRRNSHQKSTSASRKYTIAQSAKKGKLFGF